MASIINAATSGGLVTSADTSGILQLQTASTTAVTVDASQNVGLGVTPSAWGSSWKAIEVGGKGSSLFSLSAGDNTYLTSNAFFNGTNWIYAYTSLATTYNMAGGVHKWNIAPSGTAGNAITFTQAMTLDASGNLGVGTTSPQLKFVVSNAGAQGFEVNPNSGIISGGIDILCYNRSAAAYKPIYTNAEYHVWATSTTERARIDSSGNLLVGTTSVDGDGSKIQKSSSQNRVFTVQNTANVNGDQGLWIKLGSNCNTTASPAFVCDTGGTNRLLIWGNGNVVNTNNSYGAISDVKLKENIVDASPKLADLMQVKVRSYNMIGETTKQLGVVAQELETVFPTMVDESPDRDADNNVLETTTKSVKYSVFVPMLIKALQELKAEFDAYKASHP